jgi:hypothetical protein
MTILPRPAGVGPTPPPQAKSFSEYAENKMWDYYKNPGSQVGSAYTGDRSGGEAVTDCITYVRQVLEYAFTQVGEPEHARGVRAHYQKGTELAEYLTSIGWSAYYWNPDVRNPRDNSPEHPAGYKKAEKENTYYRIPLSGFIINYKLTRQPPPPGFLDRLLGAKSSGPTQDLTAFNKFSHVRFAYGLARGGMHTFLLSYGMVFEVHWNQIGAGLYERSPFYDYKWLSGVVIVPDDSDFSL